MRLTHKILFLALFPLAIGGVVILVVGFYFNVKALRVEAEQRVFSQVEMHGQAIRDFFDSYLRSVKLLAESDVLRRGKLEEILPQLKRWEPVLPDIEALYYNELDGTVHDCYGKTFSVADRYYYPAIQRGEIVISKPIVSRATNESIVLLLVPVFDQDGRRLGALGGTIKITKIIERIRQIRIGSTGFAVLIDSEGNMISGAMDGEGGAEAKKEIMRAADNSGRRVVDIRLQKESCHVYWCDIQAAKWRLALISKENEEFRNARLLSLHTVLMLIGTGLLSLFLAFVLRRILLRPIRRLMEVQQRTASGDLSARVLELSDDELGDLGRSFNKMLDAMAEANNRLRDSEAMLRSVFNVAPVGICIVDPNRDIRTVNDGMLGMSGYSSEELIGKNTRFLYYSEEEYMSRALPLYVELAQKGKAAAEGRIRRKDGSGLDVLVGISLLRQEKPSAGTVVVLVDMTRHKESERALRESEEKFRTIFEHAPYGMLITDLDGRYIDVNSRFCELYELPREQIVGRRYDECREFFRPENMEHFKSFNAKLEQQGYLEDEDLEMRRDSDRKKLLIVFSSRMIKLSGKPQIISMLNDVTERKHLEEELRQAQKMEAVGHLAGGVAHDFNNMLQAILGYADLLCARLAGNESNLEFIVQIQKAANRAANLTRQLLAFSRRQVLNLAPLDLNSVVEDLMKMIRRLIHENIELRLELGRLPSVNADRSQIEQVVMNLCINARDAMPDGGLLLIETLALSFDEKYCEANDWASPGDYVCLSVTDSGSGITNEVIEHIFDPFFTTKDPGQGTGLGLSTVYGVVRQHNGMIRVYSEQGKGSRFNIYLPTSKEQPAALSVHQPESNATGGHETILLAEDEEQIRELNKILLEEAGYKVLSASDGEEALALYQANKGKVNLLFLDVIMPKKGGKAVYDEIRAVEPGIKCLFTSGYSKNAVHTNFILDSGIALLQKPCVAPELLAAIRQALSGDSSKS